MKKRFNIGVVGTGHIANNFHLPVWKNNKYIDKIFLCDINKKQLLQTKKKFKINSVYSNLKDMLKSEKIDILNICTPPNLHFQSIIKAIKSNINFFVEKPFVTKYLDFLKVKKLLKKKKLVLSCALHQRFRPVSIDIKKIIEKKEIGNIYYINIIKRQFRSIPKHSKFFSEKKYSGGGPLIDLGTHYFDLISWFLNFPKIKEINSFLSNKLTKTKNFKKYLPFKKYDQEEFATGQIFYNSGCLLNYEIGYALNTSKNITLIEIFGTKGSIKWPEGKVTITKNSKNKTYKIKKKNKLASKDQINNFLLKLRKKKNISPTLDEIGYTVSLIDKLYKDSSYL